jgi:hypothetical protein
MDANLQIKNEACLNGYDILEFKYPSSVLPEIPGFYIMLIYVDSSEESTQDAEGVHYIT